MMLNYVHRVVEFKQLACLFDYIDFNTQMRRKEDLEEGNKRIWKRLIQAFEQCSVWQNNRECKGLCGCEAKEQPIVWMDIQMDGKSAFQVSLHLQRGFGGHHNEKIFRQFMQTDLRWIYVLELSKELMYRFHYNHIKHQYGDKVAIYWNW